MRLVLLAALAAACAPPEPLEGTGIPSAEFLYPPRNPTICLGPDGEIDALFVLRVDNLELVDFTTAIEEREGEGHWHLTFGSAVERSFSPFVKFHAEPGDFDAGKNIIVSVILVSNQHAPIEDADNDQLEFEIQPFGTTGCDN